MRFSGHDVDMWVWLSQLLSRILDAHGGLDRWRDYEKVEATIVSGGGFFPLKGTIQDASPRRMTASLHQERCPYVHIGNLTSLRCLRWRESQSRSWMAQSGSTTFGECLTPRHCRQCNSAWPEEPCSRIAGQSDYPMDAGESLNRNPLELLAFIDGVPALAWSALPYGSPEFFNQRFLDYSGRSPDEVYADWKSKLHRDDVEEFEKWWGELQKFRKPGQTEVRFRRSDGEYRWFQISSAPVHDEQRRLIRWYGINIDIDDRKRAEQQLGQKEERVRRLLARDRCSLPCAAKIQRFSLSQIVNSSLLFDKTISVLT